MAKMYRDNDVEQKAGKPNMSRLWRQALEHPLAKSEAKLESLRTATAQLLHGSPPRSESSKPLT